MRRRTFVAVLVGSVLGVAAGAGAQNAAPRGPGQRKGWGMQAEKEFRLGRGMGPKLMTEEEWKEHQEKMRTLQPAERDAYRREMHDKMMARAKERGMEMPAMPGPGPRAGRGPATK
jgi:hypothetical protein